MNRVSGSLKSTTCLLYTSIAGDDVTLQVFEGTEGIPTNAEVVFLYAANIVWYFLTGVFEWGAVSYTHLDVYKRQTNITITTQEQLTFCDVTRVIRHSVSNICLLYTSSFQAAISFAFALSLAAKVWKRFASLQ